jgi:Na+-transporting methylmalonyl-CoA/oxaloacetate decarboxylase gamma subunit
MFSMNLKELLPQVITSWQVWATILALVVYMYLVGFVARTYHRPRSSKPKRKKKEAKSAPAADQDETVVPV